MTSAVPPESDLELIEGMSRVAKLAGARALTHYQAAAVVEFKPDASPLTMADRAAHELICVRLAELEPHIPIVSEESDTHVIPTDARFWLVDPLDGTKEFIKRSGEFTVNIALIVDHEPRLGVVHVPVTGETYLAAADHGAFHESASGERVRITARAPAASPLTVVASRDHTGPALGAILARMPGAKRVSRGSSIKFCLVAEGAADVYVRDVPTMEWDTAAAQCIVEAAGGVVRDWEGRPLRYGKPDLRNPSIYAAGDPTFTLDPYLT